MEPVLAKAFVKRGNAVLIKLGDKEIDFNPDFRLYITTKLGAIPCGIPDANICTTTCAPPAARLFMYQQQHWTRLPHAPLASRCINGASTLKISFCA